MTRGEERSTSDSRVNRSRHSPRARVLSDSITPLAGLPAVKGQSHRFNGFGFERDRKAGGAAAVVNDLVRGHGHRPDIFP